MLLLCESELYGLWVLSKVGCLSVNYWAVGGAYRMWLCDSDQCVTPSHVVWQFVTVICNIMLTLTLSSENKNLKLK